MCPAYQEERNILARKVGQRRMNIGTLLTDKEILKDLLIYLAWTHHLSQVFGNLTPPEPPSLAWRPLSFLFFQIYMILIPV